MEKKTKVSVISFSIAAASLIAISGMILSPGTTGFRADGTTTTWNHYNGVSATAHKKGIKEYWVNCETHEHQFTAPTGDVAIQDIGTPSESFINALESTDDRLISKYPKLIDFEDFEVGDTGTASFYYFNRPDSIYTIVADEGVDGSQALQITTTRTDGNLYSFISKELLDAVFAKDDVESLSFAAKANYESGKFSYRAGSGARYEKAADTTGYGLLTEYKTFYLTRAIYNQMTTNNDYLFLAFTTDADHIPTVYLDDFKVSYNNDAVYNFISMESGYLNAATNAYYLRDGLTNQADFQITYSEGVVSEITRDYVNRSEGIASLCVNKVASGNVNYTFGNADTHHYKRDNLPDEGVFFDIYCYNAVNISWTRASGDSFVFRPGAMSDGNGGILWHDFNRVNNPVADQGHTLNAGQWVTLHSTKAQMNNALFMAFSGGTTGKYCIDNIRLANGVLESFESAHAFVGGLENNVFAGAAREAVTATIGAVPAVNNLRNYIFMTEWGNVANNNAPSAEISDEFASDGDYSLKIFMNGTKPLRMSPSYMNMLYKDGGTITFDVYTEDMPNNKLSFNTLGGNTKTITKGEWSTVSLTIDDFIKNSAYNIDGRFTEGAFGNGTIYVDNIRYTAA